MSHPHHHEEHRGHADHQGEMDPHVWLSPPLAKIQAQTICNELCRADPPHREDYRKNLAALHADLDHLHAKLTSQLAPLKGRTFYVLHPAFGYFGATYGLKQEAVETGGKAPGLKHIRELLGRARAEGVKVIFVQPQFSDRQAKTLAGELGGSVVAIDPLAYDYVANLQDIASKIRQALAPGAP
jgi:zinc transport system substrate-binding protein